MNGARPRAVRLQHCSWPEVEAYLRRRRALLLPAGSTEQHGPTGPIGTDALCADAVACAAAEQAGALVAPVLAYAPAQFNMDFPGTVSVSARTFVALFDDVVAALHRHGFERVYVLNGHGANLAPLAAATHDLYARLPTLSVRLRSWWQFAAVDALRDELYGAWEGLHATPSEIAITRRLIGTLPGEVTRPERPLSPEFLAEHGGDRHPPAARHRRDFPDGCVGSDPNLATAEHGARLLAAAAAAVATDFLSFADGD